MTFDTKLGVALDPWQFLSDLGQLWHDRGGFGGIQDQYVGYVWPMLPFYGLCKLINLPVWLAERLWLSLIVSVAFWGALRLAERLRIGTPASRLLAAVAYALWPVFTIVVGSTSAAALPGAFLPWVLLPLTNERYSARVAALRSALIIPFMGGVNAASTLAVAAPRRPVSPLPPARPPAAQADRLVGAGRDPGDRLVGGPAADARHLRRELPSVRGDFADHDGHHVGHGDPARRRATGSRICTSARPGCRPAGRSRPR